MASYLRREVNEDDLTADDWLALHDPKYARMGVLDACRIERNRELRASRSCASITLLDERNEARDGVYVRHAGEPAHDIESLIATDPTLRSYLEHLAGRRQGTKRVARYVLSGSPLSVARIADLERVSRRQIFYDKRCYRKLLQEFTDARHGAGVTLDLLGLPDSSGVSARSLAKRPRPRRPSSIPGQLNFMHLLRQHHK